MHSNEQTLSCVFKQSFLFQNFWVKVQKMILKEKWFESSFYKIDVVVTNWSVRLEKHETIGIFLMVDFLRIFINVTFFKIY